MNFIPKRSGNSQIPLFAIILLLVEFVRGAALVSFLPLYGTNTLGLTLDVVGAAITAHYLTDTVLKMGIGYLLDRFSIRLVVLVGLLASLAGILLLPLAHTPWVFISAAALYGVGISPIWIVCLTGVKEDKRATQMGTLYTIWLGGLGAGPIVCNIVLDYSNRAAYLMLLVSILAALALALFISGRNNTADVQHVPLREQLPVLKERIHALRLLLPGMVLQTAVAGMLVTVLPTFVTDKLALSGAQYSLLLAAGGVLTLSGLMPFGKLSDKLSHHRRWFLVTGFFAVAATLYALASTDSFAVCIALAALLGFSYAAVLPAWNALLAAFVPPSQKGLGWGMLSTVEGIGAMIGPVVGGVIATWRGEPFVVWLSALLFGIIGLCYCFLPLAEASSSRTKLSR
ncbi:MFS transporter [Paenibacillus herberti]|uniref:MFS transporter n=1 Tax=Paenibacillus herberti TaxID=1619309 RepID=A0A229NWH4_9BACL|nr:MFS transporter [Paenibacillus herberti]OXM14075.1 MFS transporter [Paenibacillus herberti]